MAIISLAFESVLDKVNTVKRVPQQGLMGKEGKRGDGRAALGLTEGEEALGLVRLEGPASVLDVV